MHLVRYWLATCALATGALTGAACNSLIGEQDRLFVPGEAAEAGEVSDATRPPIADGSVGPGGDGGAPTDGAAGPDATGDASGADAGDGGSPARTYADRIRADHPLAYWRFGEAPGTAVAYADDGTGVVGTSPACPLPDGSVWNGCYGTDLTLGQPGAIVGDPNTSVAYQGDPSFGDTRLANPPSILGVPPLSLEIWANLKANNNGYAELFSYGVRNGDGGMFDSTELMELVESSTGVRATIQSLSVSAPTVSLNTWHHFVITFNGRLLSLYVDGQLAAFANGSGVVDGFAADGGDFQIGGRETYAGWTPDGDLDEVAYYPVVLDAGTVAAHYAAAGYGDAGTDAGADAAQGDAAQ